MGFATREQSCLRLPGLTPAADAVLSDIGVPIEHRRIVRLAESGGRDAKASRPGSSRLTFVSTALLKVARNPYATDAITRIVGLNEVMKGFELYGAEGGEGLLVLAHFAADRAQFQDRSSGEANDSRLVLVEDPSAREYEELLGEAAAIIDSVGLGGPTAATNDALVRGRPVIGNLMNHQLAPLQGFEYPGCQARTAREIADALWWVERHPDDARALGLRNSAFASQALTPTAAALRLISWVGLTN